jgi:cold shock CspA family protein/ribosome-associated translation inhibitor RaiA
MQLPIQITFRRMERSPAIEEAIRKKAASLDQYAKHIMSCRIVVQPASQHRLHGNQFEVRIDITLPGGEVEATREPSERKEYKEIAVAIRDAFDTAARRLEEYVRVQRGDVKFHSDSPHACVSKLVPAEDYGFLETPEGRQLYFHRNSVLNESYDRLQLGTEVRFEEEEGERGPQASTVKIVGRHGGR